MCKKQTHQFLTVQQNLKSSLWTQDWDWMGCLLWNCGIQSFLFLEMFLVFQMDRGNLIVMFINVISLTKKSNWWKTLMLFLEMSNPRVKKLHCMYLRTMKLESKWLLMTEVQRWDTSPEPTELLLIGCSIELIWILKSKYNTSTPKINSQTSWQRAISHVMNGIICWLFYISNFSSTFCIAAMAKRAQQDWGKERFAAKSRPMMNLTARMQF